jgi:hypothetical protein
MRNKINILLITALSFLSYGCASTDTWFGNRTIYDTDLENVNDSIEFKYAFRQIMPKNERVNFEKKLSDSNYKSDTWTKTMQREGFNALAIEASGVGALSQSGQAMGLGLSLVDSYLNGLSEVDQFSYMVFSDEWLGGKFDNKDEAHKVAISKTATAIGETIKDFGYSMRCIAECGNLISNYELTRIVDKKPKDYHPEKLYAQLIALGFKETNDLDKKIFSNDSHFKAYKWVVRIIDTNGKSINDKKHKTLSIPESFNTPLLKQATFKDIRGYDLYQTKLGRDIVKSLSTKLKNWVVADNKSLVEYGLMNGEMYRFSGSSSAKDFRGNLTTN